MGASGFWLGLGEPPPAGDPGALKSLRHRWLGLAAIAAGIVAGVAVTVAHLGGDLGADPVKAAIEVLAFPVLQAVPTIASFEPGDLADLGAQLGGFALGQLVAANPLVDALFDLRLVGVDVVGAIGRGGGGEGGGGEGRGRDQGQEHLLHGVGPLICRPVWRR